MGVLFGYYAAADDDDAARAVVPDDDEPDGTGYDEVDTKGIDPVVQLGAAYALVAGRSLADIQADPRHGHLVAMIGEGELVSVALADDLRDALVIIDEHHIGDVARAWALSDGIWGTTPDPEPLADFLRDLAALAVRAVAREQHLYCWVCP